MDEYKSTAAKTTQLDNLQSLVGKTISRIADSSCNCIEIEFTDGTIVMLDVSITSFGLGTIDKFVLEEKGE